MSLHQKDEEQNRVQTRAESEPLKEGWFDCNICLDTSHEPVVTQCGHLYCWSCIYEWLTAHRRTCPVCKTHIAVDHLIPLYGRGAPVAKKTAPTPVPRRPVASPGLRMDERDNPLDGYRCVSGMEMVYARVFGMTLMGSPYNIPSGGRRRHEMLITRSLHRFSLFLFCCVFLCLVFF